MIHSPLSNECLISDLYLISKKYACLTKSIYFSSVYFKNLELPKGVCIMRTDKGIKDFLFITTILVLTICATSFSKAQNENHSKSSFLKDSVLPIYSQGLVSKTIVSINGAANTVLASANVHGNNGYSMNGTLKHVLSCIERDETGLCLNLENAAEPWTHFTGALNQTSYLCDTNNSALFCGNNKPKYLIDNPFNPWDIAGVQKNVDVLNPVINPEATLILGLIERDLITSQHLQTSDSIASRRTSNNISLHTIADTNGDGVYNQDSAYGVVDNPTNLTALLSRICQEGNSTFIAANVLNSQLSEREFDSEKTICTLGNVIIPSATKLQSLNLILLEGSRLHVEGQVSLDHSVVIHMGGNFEMKSGIIKDSIIYSAGSIGIQKNVSVQGVSSMLSHGGISFLGSTIVAHDQEGPFIGLNVVAGGDILFNGSSDTYGIYQTRGSYRQNGHSHIFGTVLAEKDILMNGGIEINATMPVYNPTLAQVPIDMH